MTKSYVVIKDFSDLEDEGYIYRAGDVYPREGVELDEERTDSLLTTDNKRKTPLIVQIAVDEEPDPEAEEVEPEESDGVPDEFPVHTGGGHFELSNGDKVKGKEKAIAAEKALKE